MLSALPNRGLSFWPWVYHCHQSVGCSCCLSVHKFSLWQMRIIHPLGLTIHQKILCRLLNCRLYKPNLYCWMQEFLEICWFPCKSVPWWHQNGPLVPADICQRDVMVHFKAYGWGHGGGYKGLYNQESHIKWWNCATHHHCAQKGPWQNVCGAESASFPV